MDVAALRRCPPLALLWGTGLLLVAACASGPSPTPALTRAEVAIEEAEEAQAGAHAAAPFALAQDKYARAQEAAGRDDNRTAIRLAEQAAADAELAEAQARAEVAQQNLAEVEEGLGVLREEALEDEPLQ